jgi:cytochrome c5
MIGHVFDRRSVVRGLLLVVSLVVLFVALLEAGQDPAPERGEQIMNAACRTCHDLRPVDTAALDEAGWTREVASMVEKGAEISKGDVPVLVDYLVRMHGPLPEGPGKEILLNTCTRCHDLQRIRRQGRSPEGWLEILDAMLNEGAPLSEEELPALLRYLARSFRPER